MLAGVLAVKAVVLAQLGRHPLLQPHGNLDTAAYVELARSVVDGGPRAIGEPFFLSPLYVYFLAAVFKGGGSLLGAKVVQILLGTAAVGLIWETARHWHGAGAAWVAAALAALTGLFTFQEVLTLQAALDPFLAALALALVSRTQADDRLWPLAAAGMSAGLLALNRPNALGWGLAAGILITLSSRRSQRDGAAPSFARLPAVRGAVFTVCLLLALAPSALHNYAVSGDLVPIASHGGLNFYIGNNADADGKYRPVEGITPSIAGQARDAARVAEAEAGRPLSPGEVSGHFYRRAWDWIAQHPGQALRLFAWKVALLLNRAEVPLNYSYAYYRWDERTLLRALAVGPWLLVPLGLVGLLVPSMRARRPGYWVWASFVPVYGLSVAAFFVTSRYRLPLLVPLCVSAGGAVAWGAQRIRERRPRPVAAPAVAALVLGVVVSWPLGVDDGRGGEQQRRAVWLVEQGSYDEARRYVTGIAAAHPTPSALHIRVGEAFAAASRLDDAVAQFRAALAIDPSAPEARLALGQALVVTGQPREAAALLVPVLEAGHRPELSAPWLGRALALSGDRERAVTLLAGLPLALASARRETADDLGELALELRAPAQAVRWLEVAARDPAAAAGVHENLGVALLLLGRAADAVGPLETACRLEPGRASAHLNLAVAHAELGHVEMARAHAEEARQLDPREPRAAALLDRLSRR